MAFAAWIKQPREASSSPLPPPFGFSAHARTRAPTARWAFTTGFVCWAKTNKNTAFNNATEIWLFIEMGPKTRLSGEIGIRETNARPPFCWSLCASDGRWYPASCIWQRKTTTWRVTLIWRRWSEAAASARMKEAGPKTPSSTATVTAVTSPSTKVNISVSTSSTLLFFLRDRLCEAGVLLWLGLSLA